MGQGLQWERQLVAVSANDSKLEHHKTLTFRYFRTDKSLALYNLFFLNPFTALKAETTYLRGLLTRPDFINSSDGKLQIPEITSLAITRLGIGVTKPFRNMEMTRMTLYHCTTHPVKRYLSLYTASSTGHVIFLADQSHYFGAEILIDVLP